MSGAIGKARAVGDPVNAGHATPGPFSWGLRRRRVFAVLSDSSPVMSCLFERASSAIWVASANEGASKVGGHTVINFCPRAPRTASHGAATMKRRAAKTATPRMVFIVLWMFRCIAAGWVSGGRDGEGWQVVSSTRRTGALD